MRPQLGGAVMSTKHLEEIIERVAIASTPADALSAIIPIGAVTHLLFTQQEPETDGSIYRVLQVRLVVPTDQLQAIGRLLLAGRLDIAKAIDDQGEPVGVH
jgi:hypothetical protein